MATQIIVNQREPVTDYELRHRITTTYTIAKCIQNTQDHEEKKDHTSSYDYVSAETATKMKIYLKNHGGMYVYIDNRGGSSITKYGVVMRKGFYKYKPE